MQHVLQISDCHLVVESATLLEVDTQATLERVLEAATGTRQPDAIIASGDLAHDPVRDVYSRFLQTVRQYSDAPLLCLPGNHDVLGVMQVVGLPMEAVQIGPWRLIGLDSHEDELPRALITQSDRVRVVQQMQTPSTQPSRDNHQNGHLLVATHHPLVEINSPWLDKDRIQNPQELVEWLSERAGQHQLTLRGMVFGHAHQPVEGQCGAIPVFGVPSTCFQFEPESAAFSVTQEAPGYRWLQLDDDGAINTQVCRVQG